MNEAKDQLRVPFFRPSIGEDEIAEVVSCLRSGWLTTGNVTKRFEQEFANFVGARHAIAVNSCTAALHLALEAVGVKRGDMVLVPDMTFAATAEVVRYFDATPVLVDCDPDTLCIDPEAVRRTLLALREQRAVPGVADPTGTVRALIPMHYGGQMADVDTLRRLADEHALVLIEDAAHTLPAYTRSSGTADWRSVGTTADMTCFSFYANKCITTGEGGMVVTDNEQWADRMRLMSLHGMSKDAWQRYSSQASWYYEIVAPGFKYNLTDIAAAIGVHQLRRATELWHARSEIAQRMLLELSDVEELELPRQLENRKHAWHLFQICLRLERLTVDRDAFIELLRARGVACSVHWMPLHLHPYYKDTYRYEPDDFPVAAKLWPRLVSLPIFPAMTEAEIQHVIRTVRAVVGESRLR